MSEHSSPHVPMPGLIQCARCEAIMPNAAAVQANELLAEVERLREDYRDLLCAHPDDQHQALQAYLSSRVDGRRTIDAAREEIQHV